VRGGFQKVGEKKAGEGAREARSTFQEEARKVLRSRETQEGNKTSWEIEKLLGGGERKQKGKKENRLRFDGKRITS